MKTSAPLIRQAATVLHFTKFVLDFMQERSHVRLPISAFLDSYLTKQPSSICVTTKDVHLQADGTRVMASMTAPQIQQRTLQDPSRNTQTGVAGWMMQTCETRDRRGRPVNTSQAIFQAHASNSLPLRKQEHIDTRASGSTTYSLNHEATSFIQGKQLEFAHLPSRTARCGSKKAAYSRANL